MRTTSPLSFKNINRLAIPALLTGIAEPILSATDAAVVGNIEINPTEALAAVGIVGSFLSALIWVLGQTRSALQAIIAQYYGAGKIDEIKNLPAQAVYLNIILSILILGGTLPFINGIFSLYNAQDLILEYCVEYYGIRVWGFPLTLLTFAIFGIFRGLQNTFWPMVVAIIGALLNIGLDFALVYGIADWLPEMGLRGAAYASLIAQAVMALLSLILLFWKTDISLKLRFPINPELYRLIGMALNLFVRTIALNLALYLANSFATDYGPSFIAAQTILINIWLFSSFFIDGYAAAGNILAGRLLGAKDYDGLWQLSKKVSLYGVGVSIFLMVVGMLFYEPLGLIFSKEPAVIARYSAIFFIIILMQPINAIAFIFDGIFKGMGEMKYLRNVLLLATFFGFVPAIFIGDYFGLELYSIWIAFSVWMLIRGVALILKFRKRFKPKVSEAI
ncbi:MATE family efflux transporter [Flavimarina sp. Hel_I_48]|uniref:MATE family efflux transporter n=1 Tax=Flavimarina sp. Hel_I_48 TaxID=1392488 RepID=UPI0004DF665A|nr:MATE family efflux transporter [Flavimarina sp. Hel_I_48]